MARFYFYLLGLLAFASILVEAKDIITPTGRLACTSKRLCSKIDEAIWKKRREYAHKIAAFVEQYPGFDMYSE